MSEPDTLKTPSDQPQVWVDVIRTVAIVAVILVHVTAPITLEFGTVASWNWHVGNTLDSLARPCVPLFFMISGYLLLGRLEPAALFFKKRLTRIAAPMILWSLFYIAFKNRADLSALGPSDFTALLTHPAEYHLWFLYALIAVYLFVPALRLLVATFSSARLQLITALWLAVASIGPTLEWGFDRDFFGSLDLLMGYSGYALAGYVLGKLTLTRPHIISAAAIASITYVVITWGTWEASTRAGAFVTDVYNYVGPLVIIYSCAAFVLLRAASQRYLDTPTTRIQSWIGGFATLSFGIYLIHAAVLELLFESGLAAFNVFGTNPVLTVLTTTFVTLVISTALIALAHRMPFLQRIVG